MRIRISWDKDKVVGILNDTPTAKKLLKALPCESTANTWGDEVYFIYGAVHIVESWSYFARKRSDHTLKQIAEGEIKVSELRPEDRDEALVVMMESREGAHFLWLTPILRDSDAVTLGATLAFPEKSAGRFDGLFEP